jgi:hypothetical protein
MTSIAPEKWVEFLYGKNEEQLLACATPSMASPLPVSLPIPAHGVKPGAFQVLTVRQLATQLAPVLSASIPPPQAWPVFTIHVRKPRLSDNSAFDTSSLQVNPHLTRPLFQVASNFNAQENGSLGTDLFDGTYLTDLMTDKTQGPAASASAGAGAVVRWVAHRTRAINLLENLPALEVTNGKLTRIRSGYESADFLDVGIGLHTDVSACFERAERRQCVVVLPAPTIDQVYTSTACMPLLSKQSSAQQVAKSLLKSAYDGTYLAALSRRTATLVLTLIGGGCFRNDMQEIANALARAHYNYGRKGALNAVLLPLYESHDAGKVLAKIIVDALKAANVPQETIQVLER